MELLQFFSVDLVNFSNYPWHLQTFKCVSWKKSYKQHNTKNYPTKASNFVKILLQVNIYVNKHNTIALRPCVIVHKQDIQTA